MAKRGNSRMPSPFKYRGRWRAQVTLKNGTRPAENFDSAEEAKAWISDMLANQNTEHEPELGGPTKATLAEARRHYAQLYSLVKGGCKAELTRINNYLVGAGMNRIRRSIDEQGNAVIEEYELKIEPPRVLRRLRLLRRWSHEKVEQVFA
ncbi:MAG: hypothetical protein WCG13_09655 [Burkholderiales bacterium]